MGELDIFALRVSEDHFREVEEVMTDKRFAVFILSHGRAKTISTYSALRRHGYTGPMYVVIDNEDDQEPLYREKFGNDIIQFDKRDYVALTDLGDLDDDRRIGVFARNFIQDKAAEMGYKYHLQLDDDIHGFTWRTVRDGRLVCVMVRDIDAVLSAMLDYMDSAPFTALSFGLAIYYVGGLSNSTWKKQMIPKTMTTFIMRKDEKHYFHMRMNDDITTSALANMRGQMFYSYLPVRVDTVKTQSQAGGMTDIYRDNGTYRKSFYTVMAAPSCTKISQMGLHDMRVHHEIVWNNCAPKILDESLRKEG